jgi:hypothetical protein
MIYNFPRKQAIQMAMSYSYRLQEAVLDAWDAAEGGLNDIYCCRGVWRSY